MNKRLLSEEAVKRAHSLQLRNFGASCRYIKRQKQRFGVGMCRATNESQRTLEDFLDAPKAFHSTVNALSTRQEYTLFNISEMDGYSGWLEWILWLTRQPLGLVRTPCELVTLVAQKGLDGLLHLHQKCVSL